MTELNQLYVSLTRASHEMHIFIPERIGSALNLANDLVPDDMSVWGSPMSFVSSDQPVSQKQPGKIQFSCAEWMERLRNDETSEAKGQNVRAAREGSALHYVLSALGNVQHASLSDVLARVFADAKMLFPQLEDWPNFEDGVRRLLEYKVLRKFFWIEGGDVYCEKEIVDQFGMTKRLDRLIVWPNQAWVIDYKMSQSALESHQNQVRAYLALLSDIYPQHRLQGFLIYIEKGQAPRVIEVSPK